MTSEHEVPDLLLTGDGNQDERAIGAVMARPFELIPAPVSSGARYFRG